MPPTFTAVLVKWAVLKGAPCKLVQLREVTDTEGGSLPPELKESGQEFSDVFGDVPHGLPPARNVGHMIP